MPQTLSAKKNVRKGAGRHLRNHAAKAAVRTQIRKLRALLAAKDAEAAPAQYKLVARLLDKTAQRGILSPNAAARYKSRLAAQLAALAKK